MRITASVQARRVALDLCMILAGAFIFMQVANTPSLRMLF